MGLVLAILSILVVEHVWVFSSFRIKQVQEIEKLINKLTSASEETKLTTFEKQAELFLKGKPIKFNKLGEPFPKGSWEKFLVKSMPHQADRIVMWFLIPLWIVFIIASI